jgi:hypothetical protein
MNKIKCAQCGLVNWSTEVECKRCGSLLTVQDKLQRNVHLEEKEPKRLFSGVIIFLTVTLGLAVLGLMVTRVVPVIDGEAAKMVAAMFMITGVGFAVLIKFCIIVRIFQQSVGWGLASMFVPLAALIAIVKFWETTRRSVVGYMVCMGIMAAGYYMMPDSFHAASTSS